MLRYGGIKIVADGSIQGYTAVMNWPGYVNNAPNGLWQVPPDSLPGSISAFHRAGIPVHVHCNGDALIDAMIDAVDDALREHSWLDHRHTVQHCQLTSAAQYRRMAKLGICGNIFANHLWYWGDQHYESTVGPERAHRMEACGTALRSGVSFSLHTDAAVTPIGQLHSMWCAVNRVTPKGRVLGPHERISAHDALASVTIDAAYQMHLDHQLGSIEVGKRADFTVLEESPLEVEPMEIKDIGVWGTVVSGQPHPASGV
jgi:predicted amidohydrolase YtcJ